MQGHIGRPRVLLADDARDVFDQVDRLLGGDFEIVGVARNGEQAIQLAKALEPDILILDIAMPIFNGMEVASHLRQFDSGLTIVFLTCHADPDYIDAAFSLGALGYVLKRCMTNDLIPALNAALKGTRFASRLQSHASIRMT